MLKHDSLGTDVATMMFDSKSFLYKVGNLFHESLQFKEFCHISFEKIVISSLIDLRFLAGSCLVNSVCSPKAPTKLSKEFKGLLLLISFD